jgi:hypothetical protein
MGHFPSTPTKAPLPKDPFEILPNLRILKAAGNGIGCAGLPEMWPAKVQEIELADNALSAAFDLSAFAALSCLEQLGLQGNAIVSCLNKSGAGFKLLRYLDLSANKINEVGWIGKLTCGRNFSLKGLEDWEGCAAVDDAASDTTLNVVSLLILLKVTTRTCY